MGTHREVVFNFHLFVISSSVIVICDLQTEAAMATSSNQKLKLLYLLKILLEQTDENHVLSMQELLDALAEYGIRAERKTIYADLDLLRRFGFSVEMLKSKTFGYCIDRREFELPELKLLVDAVQSSQLISVRRSNELIAKLGLLTSVHHAKALKRHVVTAKRPKSLNKTTYYSIDAIHEAINSGRKITFCYFDYDMKKKRVYRKNSERYSLTPVTLTWNDDKYYLIGYRKKYDGFSHYRVDRMCQVEVSGDAADRFDRRRFNMADYAKRMFGMFNGELMHATLRFHESLVNVVLDAFGTDTAFRLSDDRFEITVEVSNSPVFLAWMFQFGNKAEIIGPSHLRQAMRDLLELNARQYEQGVEKFQ